MRRILVVAGLTIGTALGLPLAAEADPYANCTEAANDGSYNIPRGSPAYAPKLDGDGDGVACEARRPSGGSTVELANTGVPATGIALGGGLLLLLGAAGTVVARRKEETA